MKKSNKKPTIKKTNPKKNSKIIVDVYVPKFDDLWNNHPSILKENLCACSYVRGAEDLANWLNQKNLLAIKLKAKL